MTGFDIRARKIIVPTGSKIKVHEHSKTPGIVYIAQGNITEIRNNKKRQLATGDMIVEDVDTIHAWENNSDNDCILIAFDLPKSTR